MNTDHFRNQGVNGTTAIVLCGHDESISRHETEILLLKDHLRAVYSRIAELEKLTDAHLLPLSREED